MKISNGQSYFEIASLMTSSAALSRTSFFSDLSPQGIAICTGVNTLTLAMTDQGTLKEKIQGFVVGVLCLCAFSQPLATLTSAVITPIGIAKLAVIHAIIRVSIDCLAQFYRHDSPPKPLNIPQTHQQILFEESTPFPMGGTIFPDLNLSDQTDSIENLTETQAKHDLSCFETYCPQLSTVIKVTCIGIAVILLGFGIAVQSRIYNEHKRALFDPTLSNCQDLDCLNLVYDQYFPLSEMQSEKHHEKRLGLLKQELSGCDDLACLKQKYEPYDWNWRYAQDVEQILIHDEYKNALLDRTLSNCQDRNDLNFVYDQCKPLSEVQRQKLREKSFDLFKQELSACDDLDCLDQKYQSYHWHSSPQIAEEYKEIYHSYRNKFLGKKGFAKAYETLMTSTTCQTHTPYYQKLKDCKKDEKCAHKAFHAISAEYHPDKAKTSEQREKYQHIQTDTNCLWGELKKLKDLFSQTV